MLASPRLSVCSTRNSIILRNGSLSLKVMLWKGSARLKKLTDQLNFQTKLNVDLQRQVESLDVNSRLSSLILTCSEFGTRIPNEDIEKKVVEVLNKRFGNLHLTVADIQAAHRLQSDDKVIVKFGKRQIRDSIYDGRFDINRRAGRAGDPGRGVRFGPHWVGESGREVGLVPLYINESLTPANRAIYNELLEARKSTNGAKIASVFSRRGVVYCRREKGGANISVADQERLRSVLGGARFPPSRRGRRPALMSPSPDARGPGGRPVSGVAAGGEPPSARPGLDPGAASSGGPGVPTPSASRQPESMMPAASSVSPAAPGDLPASPSVGRRPPLPDDGDAPPAGPSTGPT